MAIKRLLDDDYVWNCQGYDTKIYLHGCFDCAHEHEYEKQTYCEYSVTMMDEEKDFFIHPLNEEQLPLFKEAT